MIAYFSVENFYSIADKQEINFFAKSHASELKDLDGEIGRRVIEGEDAILPVVGIFGANASGKTNLLNALDILIEIYTHGGPEEFSEFGVGYRNQIIPFKFDESYADKPTTFEIILAIDNSFLEYTISFHRNIIVQESLVIITNKKPQKVFERKLKDKSIKWVIGEDFFKNKNEAELILQSSKNLKGSKLFLKYIAETFNYEVITKIDRYIQRSSVGFFHEHTTSMILDNYVNKIINKNDDKKSAIVSFLSMFDTGIIDLKLTNNKLFSVHSMSDGKNLLLDFNLESQGIKQLKKLSTLILNSLSTGRLLVIDEIDAHLHHHLSSKVIKLYQSRISNPLNAQLVFASHDVQLMDVDLIKREQIYISSRSKIGKTSYICLGNLKGLRKDRKLSKSYMEGVFSGVPILDSDERFYFKVSSLAKLYNGDVNP